jgi:hypothetical protein
MVTRLTSTSKKITTQTTAVKMPPRFDRTVYVGCIWIVSYVGLRAVHTFGNASKLFRGAILSSSSSNDVDGPRSGPSSGLRDLRVGM